MKTIRIFLASGALLLAACGAPATVAPTQTSIPLPTSTDTPVPPTATSEPTVTPDPLLFRDDFEGSLGEGWQWIRQDDRYWSLVNSPGWLEIVARPGNVVDGNLKNLLLRPAPQGDFDLETTLRFRPTGNYQLAGLLIYQSADEYVQFGRAFCNAPQCARDGFYLDQVHNGGFTSENFATSAPETDTVHLRLRREGGTYTGYVSVDGDEWTPIGAHSSAMAPLFVGVVAGQAVGSTPKPAQFDDFLITALP